MCWSTLKASPRPALGTRTSAALLALGVLAGGASPAGATSPSLTWSSPRRIDTHGLLDIRCPTASLCVAIDSAGDVLTTKTPLAGAKGWKRAHVDNGLSALACPWAGPCVAVDSRGDVLTSEKPAGGAGVGLLFCSATSRERSGAPPTRAPGRRPGCPRRPLPGTPSHRWRAHRRDSASPPPAAATWSSDLAGNSPVAGRGRPRATMRW